MRRALLSVVAATALAASGCGSTAQITTGVQPEGDGLTVTDPGLGVPLSPSSALTPSSALPSAGTTTPGRIQPSSVASTGAPSVGPATRAPSASATGPASGFGFTATKAYIGVEYIDGGDAFLAGAGFGSLTTGDARALVNTMVADINRKGGVLGRQVVPVYQGTGAVEGSSNPDVTAQSVCAKFTQDQKVFAAVIASPALACLAKARVMNMYFANSVDDTELNRTAPFTRRPSAYSFTHLAPVLIDRLVAQRYLTPSSKVGILWPEESSGAGKRVFSSLKSLLAVRGFKVVADFGYDFSSAVAAPVSVPNAVLPFRSAGVDRVISIDASVAYFMMNAENQGYRPRYALNSNLNLASVMESVPPWQQLVGAVGVGWQPINDVRPSQLDVPPPGFATCKKYIADSGQRPTGSALSILTLYCDSVRLALFAAQAGGGFDSTSINRGLADKGTAYPSASVIEAGFSARRMDGARGARDIGYNVDCRCFKYLSRIVHRG